ncbi:MAG TPA: hypothetical protein VKD90_18435 [Gemmataceae bacterium]|nr:hypothetical protein [Gemmataceae bacterium]
MNATANISDRISRLTEEGLIGMVEATASMGTFRGGRPCHPGHRRVTRLAGLEACPGDFFEGGLTRWKSLVRIQ